MWIGYIGLATTFIILSALMLLMFIKPDIKKRYKMFIIPFILWYGLTLYWTPSKLMGWPSKDEILKGSIIYSFYIIEPDTEKEGGIYFWIIDRNNVKKDLIQLKMLPMKVFMIVMKGVPKSHSIPYDRETHKRLLEMQKKMKKRPGSIMIYDGKQSKGKKEKKSEISEGEKVKFKILNPAALMRKSDDGTTN